MKMTIEIVLEHIKGDLKYVAREPNKEPFSVGYAEFVREAIDEIGEDFEVFWDLAEKEEKEDKNSTKNNFNLY